MNELYSQLYGLCLDFLSKSNIIRDVENIAEDIRGEVIDKILKSADNDFWKENKEYSLENDKKINAYIYKMIRGSNNDIKDNFADGKCIII
ncbi:MAG: hypothetical protein IPN57_07965 [Ignavibacteria bacterium]|nr:hypothetical protein [Ignavibacteria bacterium]